MMIRIATALPPGLTARRPHFMRANEPDAAVQPDRPHTLYFGLEAAKLIVLLAAGIVGLQAGPRMGTPGRGLAT